MRDRASVLVLHANGPPGWKRIAADTLIGSADPLLRRLPERARRHRLVRRLLEGSPHNQRSYARDWLEAFCAAPRLAVTACNILDLIHFRRELGRIRRYDLVVVLHSVTSTNFAVIQQQADRLRRRRGRLVVFFANEFHQIPQKVRFAGAVGADFIASQLTLPAAQWLYAEARGARVLAAPHALNPELYFPGDAPRTIDVGFRGDNYESRLLGDREREEIVRRFAERSADWGLTACIEMGRTFREDWADFLRASRATIGAEAGTYFLEKDDRSRSAAYRYLQQHPGATFEEVYQQVFRDYPDPVSGKTISSRHFEAVGTKTCQILVEGDYYGILRPDEHYIAVKKDFSNLDDAVERFKDQSYRQRLVDQTYEYVRSTHTYADRVQALLAAVDLPP